MAVRQYTVSAVVDQKRLQASAKVALASQTIKIPVNVKAEGITDLKVANTAMTKLTDSVGNTRVEIDKFNSKFIQQSYFIGADEWQESKGSLSFKKPGKMNWQYFAPDEQTFVTNSNIVYWYQPKEKQVTIRNINSAFNSEIPLSFLLGVGELKDDFTAIESCETEDGILVKLDPKNKTDSLSQFFLLVNNNDYFLE